MNGDNAMTEMVLKYAGDGLYVDIDCVRLCWDADVFNSVVLNEGNGMVVAGRRMKPKGDPTIFLRKEEYSVEATEQLVETLRAALSLLKEYKVTDLVAEECR